LGAINDFLDESVVLPPGDWDSKNMLSMSEIQELRNRKKSLKADDTKVDLTATELHGQGLESYRTDPFIRAPYFFGGVINDLKRRFKWYLSDFQDGFNLQCFAAAVFIYFANLSGAVAFGGLLGKGLRLQHTQDAPKTVPIFRCFIILLQLTIIIVCTNIT
jgi:hypothetical protein